MPPRRRRSAIERRVLLLRKVSIFKEMSDEDLGRAAQKFDEIKYQPGDVVIRQGEIGDEFFIVHSGSAIVLFKQDDEAEEQTLAKVGRNAFFGELALMTDEPRTATIKADPENKYPLVLLRMRRTAFEELFAGRESVIEDWNPNLMERRAWEILSSMQLFSQATESQLRRMVQKMKLVKYQPACYILQQGREGKSFYIILEGIVKITRNDIRAASGEHALLELCEDDYFGEVGLLSANQARSANAIAVTRVLCFALDREAFVEAHNSDTDKELQKKAYFKQLDQLGTFNHAYSETKKSALKHHIHGVSSVDICQEDDEEDLFDDYSCATASSDQMKKVQQTKALTQKQVHHNQKAVTLADVFRSKARKILQYLHATLATRMYQNLCRVSPQKATDIYGSMVGRAFGMCANRYAFHCRIQTLLAQLRHKSPAERDPPEIAIVAGLLMQSPDFRDNFLQGWSPDNVSQLCHHVHVNFIKQGETLFDHSIQAGRAFCVVRGAITLFNARDTYRRAYQQQQRQHDRSVRRQHWGAACTNLNDDVVAATAAPGTAVGVEALDEPLDAPRKNYAHRAVALTDIIALAIRYEDFAHIASHVRAGTVSDVHHKFTLVKQVHIFRHLSPEQQYSVAYALSPLSIPRGKIILKQGETSPNLFLIANGRAKVHLPTSANLKNYRRGVRPEEGGPLLSAGINISSLERGAIFGDSGVLSKRSQLPGGTITESSMIIAESQLSLFVLKSDQYSLLDSSVVKLLEQDHSLHVARQHEHCQRQARLLALQ